MIEIFFLLNQGLIFFLVLTGLNTTIHQGLFFLSHTTAIIMAWLLIYKWTKYSIIKEVFSPSLKNFFKILAFIPLIGPLGVFFILIGLRSWQVVAFPQEEFEILDTLALEGRPLFFAIIPRFIPYISLIRLLIGKITFEEAMRIIHFLEKLSWSYEKTKLLKLFIRYVPHPSVVVETARILSTEAKRLEERIFSLKKAPIQPKSALALLYSQIYAYDLLGDLNPYFLKQTIKYSEEAIHYEPKIEIFEVLLNALLDQGETKKLIQFLKIYQKHFPKAAKQWELKHLPKIK